MAINGCDVTVIHEVIVEQVKKEMIEEPRLNHLVELFKVLSDHTRLKIIQILIHHEMCVCDLSFLLNVSQSLISHQLKVLRDARFVKSRREGKVVFYALNDEHIQTLFEIGLIHAEEKEEENEALSFEEPRV